MKNVFFARDYIIDGANGKKVSEDIENFQLLDPVDLFSVHHPKIEFTLFWSCTWNICIKTDRKMAIK